MKNKIILLIFFAITFLYFAIFKNSGNNLVFLIFLLFQVIILKMYLVKFQILLKIGLSFIVFSLVFLLLGLENVASAFANWSFIFLIEGTLLHIKDLSLANKDL